MPEIAAIIRLFGSAYLARFGDRLLPSHARVLRDLTACRTEVLGGHLAECDQCGHQHYSYHSCRNRSCPTCHTGDRERWLARRRGELLPVSYFHVIFTLPASLRELVWRHQKQLYAVLFKAAAEALLTLTNDPRYVGGEVGILSVLHTWTRQLGRHPHVHCLVTGGGLTTEGEWVTARKRYLAPAPALAKLFRGRFMALARKALPEETLPNTLFETDWVVYCKPALQGSRKLLDYLGRYVHRIAITNRRILAIHNNHVTFEYKDSRDHCWKRCTLTGEEFLRRFLCHVLPRGFHKVRYYGLLAPSRRKQLRHLQWSLAEPEEPAPAPPSEQSETAAPQPCPVCEIGLMVFVALIPRTPRGPP